MSRVHVEFSRNNTLLMTGLLSVPPNANVSDLRYDLSRMTGYANQQGRRLVLDLQDGEVPPEPPATFPAEAPTGVELAEGDAFVPRSAYLRTIILALLQQFGSGSVLDLLKTANQKTDGTPTDADLSDLASACMGEAIAIGSELEQLRLFKAEHEQAAQQADEKLAQAAARPANKRGAKTPARKPPATKAKSRAKQSRKSVPHRGR